MGTVTHQYELYEISWFCQLYIDLKMLREPVLVRLGGIKGGRVLGMERGEVTLTSHLNLGNCVI